MVLPAFRRATLALVLLLIAGEGLAGDLDTGWYQLRGPNRDGRSTENGLVRSWGPAGPSEVWRVSVGAGFSAISVVGDRLYTMDSDAETEFALCLDARTGRTLWRVPMGPLFSESNGNGPRSTPTVDVDAERVYVLGSRGRLAALETGTGKTVWEVDFATAFDSKLPTWAFANSPLVEEDVLLAEVGGSGPRAIAAFEKSTGKLRWTSQESELAYSSPLRLELGGVRQFVFLLKQKLLALDGQGKELWSVPFAPKLDIKPAVPVFVEPDLLFVSASYDIGSKVVRLAAKGGAVTAEEVWSGRQMRNHFNSVVALDGHVYGFDTGTLRCLDARNGKRGWAKRGLGKGSLIYADGMLIVLSERGKLVLVEATTEGYRELASHQVLKGRCWTQPSLWDGRLYVRNHRELVCLDLRGPSWHEKEATP